MVQKYLQAQDVMTATVACGLIGLVVNIMGNLILMYILGMDFIGCILATMIARFSMLISVCYHLKTHALEYDTIVKEVTKILKLIGKIRHVKRVFSLAKIIGSKIYESIIFISSILYDQLVHLWRGIVDMYGLGDDNRGNAYTDNCNRGSDDSNGSSMSNKRQGHAMRSPNKVVPHDESNDEDESGGNLAKKKVIKNADTLSPLQEDLRPEIHTNSRGSIDMDNDLCNDKSTVADNSRDTHATEVELSEIRLTTGENVEQENLDDRTTLLSRGSSQNISLKRIVFGIGKFISLGLPGGVLLLIEMWSLDFTSIFISHMGNTALNAHVIFVLFTTVFHMSTVFAIATAATSRISTLLGAQQPYLAKTAAWLSVYLSLMAIVVNATLVYYGTRVIGYIFTSDDYIVDRMIKIAHIVAGFQITYGLQGCIQGCLRGIGRHLLLAGLTLLSFWGVGIPMGLYLCFQARPRLGLEGMWYGLLTGSTLLAFTSLLILLFVNWENEARRCMVRLRRKDKNQFDMISFPTPGSGTVGSVPLTHFIGFNERQEMDELEMVEYSSDVLSRLHTTAEDNL